MRIAKPAFSVLKETLAAWNEDRVPRLGAALAYYTVFSLAPLLIIAIVIAGSVFGQSTAQERIVAQIAQLVGPGGAASINRMIDSARLPPNTGRLVTAVGVVSLLVGALGVFGQLQDAFNTIWGVTAKRGGLRTLLQTRLIAFMMVLVVGFLLLVALVVNTVLAALSGYLDARIPNYGLLAATANFILPLAVIAVLFAVMFKVLPDVHLTWRDVWPGALLTSALFTLGKFAIGFYLGNSRLGTAYGAAGSVLIILVWIYYSAQILFFGAEFTQVYARRYGSGRIRPTEQAVPLSEAARLEQGMPRAETVAALSQAQEQAATRSPHARPGWPRRRDNGAPAPAGRPGPISALVGFAAGLAAGVLLALRTLRSHRLRGLRSARPNRPGQQGLGAARAANHQGD